MQITIDGLNINYQVAGEGQEVLLLHGWGAELNTFAAVHANLAQHFKVYSIDFPGFGKSQEPREVWGNTEYVEFLHKFIQAMGIKRPILLGHSFGGRISIEYASKYDVKKLVLTNTAGIKPKRKLQYYVKVYTYKAVKNILRIPGLHLFRDRVLNYWKARTGSTDYKNASGVLQQILVRVVNTDLKHVMPQIKAPVLLIFGETDTATPVEHGKTMEKLMPDAGLVVLKTGHFSYLERPQEFAIIVNKFLEKDKRGSL
ncbi:pimeloyl-ACP methyl ester carboxylesterase [Paenibacillus phyllosphaerae]|uniref:Pimeloyl-ACP methyl ester carboxylesterase n=1 Tax=Paenibacillus phyllosphaerae TaxID=274593 RepID=A0A7W5FQN2_9BACL|nr:pimeloyl-ACP methyl ester carboxylesterase [Paenibacillus phyllosphaerae]